MCKRRKNCKICKIRPTKPNQTEFSQPSLPNQTYQTKPNQNQNYWLKQSTPGSVVPLTMFKDLLKTGALVQISGFGLFSFCLSFGIDLWILVPLSIRFLSGLKWLWQIYFRFCEGISKIELVVKIICWWRWRWEWWSLISIFPNYSCSSGLPLIITLLMMGSK